MDKAATVAVVATAMVILVAIDFWQMHEIRQRRAENARLRRFLSERQRELAETRDALRDANQAAVRSRVLHDQAAAQRDEIAVELALLRDRYIEQAGAYRHLLISRLADGLRQIKFGVN